MAEPDVTAVLRSQEFYRLKTPITSPGDIFEITESSRAIYIGPDSDLGEVLVQYYNPDEPNAIQTATVSVNGPLVGRVDALNKTQIQALGQPAIILASPVDIVDNSYVPPSSIALRRYNIPAVLDLMFALKALPDVPGVRADRTHRFPSVPYVPAASAPTSTDGSTEILVPIYGRRMVTVTAVGNNLTVNLSLVTLQPGANPAPRYLGQIAIQATLPLTQPFSVAAVYRASDAARHGQTFQVDGTPSGLYIESDQPSTVASGVVDSQQVPRGMADLLLVSLTDNAGATGAQRYADIYIKVADREG